MAGPAMSSRLWSKVAKSDGGCWIWTSAQRPDGYGVFWLHGRTQMAHRVVWEALRGPIPDGLTLDHLCRNRICVNPDHLEPVTIRTNLLRGISFSARNAAKIACPRGHPYDATYITKRKRGRYCRICKRAAWHRWKARSREALP